MVLGPGYEDLLLCPPAFCVTERSTAPGFVGPSSATHECIPFAGTHPPLPVTPWGSQSCATAGDHGLARLQNLVTAGYSALTCDELVDVVSSGGGTLQREEAEPTVVRCPQGW